MRMKIYNLLVNRHAGIRSRYHRVHDGGGWGRKAVSWLYLFWLNFAYYVLFCRFLGKKEEMAAYEEKRLPVKPESKLQELMVREYVDSLSRYDVVSFDIFDTLLFRPFSEPADLFYFLGERLGRADIRRIRMEQEQRARWECHKRQGHYEVTFQEIWQAMERKTGIAAVQGMELEEELEEEFCYANPFMKRVYEELKAKGKQIICISDMYLPRDFLEKLLKKNGYGNIHDIYVSCEYGKSKADGSLYRQVRGELPAGTAVVHCGDNVHSDVRMAEKCGFASFPYPNVNRMALSFRPYDMSPMVGGAYRGIVDNHLYQGGRSYTPEYEYGFVYGGIFALGYCRFIHAYCKSHGIEKILFLSRDGDILKQVYDKMYPGECTAYVYWSRLAATKLMAEFDSYDYFRRYLYHKVNQGISIRKILEAMELQFLLKKLPADAEDPKGAGDLKGAGNLKGAEDRKGAEDPKGAGDLKGAEDRKGAEDPKGAEDRKGVEAQEGEREKAGGKIVLHPADELTGQNVEALELFIRRHYAAVCALYGEQQEAAKRYYERELQGIGRAAAVDIGWAGSGALSLMFLTERVWKLPCEITGILAGTNTVHNSEPDAAEPFLQSGKLVSYLYSQRHNRDLLKKHDPGKDYNIFWELLLASPAPQFTGFYKGRTDRNGTESRENGTESRENSTESRENSAESRGNGTGNQAAGVQYDEELDITLAFGKYEENRKGIGEIRKGILDFTESYSSHFEKFPYMLRISGRDAYAPMLIAAGHRERYLRRIREKFAPESNIN